MRCFVGVGLPQKTREALAAMARALKQEMPAARWAEEASMHFTMKFLGEIGPELSGKLGEALGRAACAPAFSVSIRGLGAFPRETSARVLWAGVADGGIELTLLAERIGAVADSLRAAKPGPRAAHDGEDRPFHPHVTLARFREPADLSRFEVYGRERETEIGACFVDRFIFFRSHLRSGGAIYEPLREYPLAAAGFVTEGACRG
jgi:2'-5' RNA ligase